VLATWILVVPTLHLMGTLLVRGDAVLVDRARWWDFVDAGTPGLDFYTSAVFCVALVRRPVLAMVVAAAGSLLLYGLFALVRFTQVAPTLSAPLAPLSVILAVALLWAAERNQREGRDLDRPASRFRLGSVLAALLGTSLATAALLCLLQVGGRKDIARDYPRIAWLADGTPVLLAPETPSRRMDEPHRRRDQPPPQAPTGGDPYRRQRPLTRAAYAPAARGRPFRGLRYAEITCQPYACYVGSDALVDVIRLGEHAPFIRQLGKAPNGERFSTRARPIGDYWTNAALMGDPQDGAVWRYPFAGGGNGFERVPLPGGDRFVEDLSHRLAPPSRLGFDASPAVVVRGESGLYVMGPTGFAVAPPDLPQAIRQQAQEMPEIRLLGPVRFELSLPASPGRPAYHHLYAPYRWSQRLIEDQMLALSLLRAPALEVASLLAAGTLPIVSPDEADATTFLDPMVALGARWLVPVNLALAALLAVLAFRRLGRLGVPPGRRLFWTATVLVLGVLGYLAQRAVENARAWRTIDAAPPAARRLLIESAA